MVQIFVQNFVCNTVMTSKHLCFNLGYCNFKFSFLSEKQKRLNGDITKFDFETINYYGLVTSSTCRH